MKIIVNLFQNFLDTNQKNSFFLLLFLMLISSILEIVGISLIIPIVAAFLGSDIIANEYIKGFLNYLI